MAPPKNLSNLTATLSSTVPERPSETVHFDVDNGEDGALSDRDLDSDIDAEDDPPPAVTTTASHSRAARLARRKAGRIGDQKRGLNAGAEGVAPPHGRAASPVSRPASKRQNTTSVASTDSQVDVLTHSADTPATTVCSCPTVVATLSVMCSSAFQWNG